VLFGQGIVGSFGSSPEAHLTRTREWPNPSPSPNSNPNPKNHSREVRFWTRPGTFCSTVA